MTSPEEAAARLSEGLYPHQIEGIAFLLGRGRSILADDMGLGKTRQSILALDHAAPLGSFLVICPAAVKTNWQREIHQVLPEDEVAVVGPVEAPDPLPRWVVINYDILGKHLDWLERDWAGLVCDEAHFLKNYRSQRHGHVRAIVDAMHGDRPLHLLTGTPLTNRPRDLFPLLQLVRHTLGRNFLTFAKRYCDAHRGEYGWVTDGASNIDELAVQLHGIMVRRTKKEVLDLPPKIRTWLEVDVASNVARSLSKAVMDLMVGAADGQGHRSGAVLGQLTTARNRLAIAKVRSTLPLIEDMVEQGEKVLVFSCFIRPLTIIEKKFKGIAVSLMGETPPEQRQRNVDRFQHDDEVRVLAANIHTGGVGLNLTAARQVVFNDLDWLPANHWQAEDRAYRIGQDETVNVTYMVARDTIDEFVRAILQYKAQIIDQVVEGRLDALGEDVFGELRAIARQLSGTDLGGDGLARAVAQHAARLAPAEDAGGARDDTPARQRATRILAEVLAGGRNETYRIESASKPGAYYELSFDGTDVLCACKAFEFRGACRHARELKQVLVGDGPLPAHITRIED